jgi:hypothetical protein
MPAQLTGMSIFFPRTALRVGSEAAYLDPLAVLAPSVGAWYDFVGTVRARSRDHHGLGVEIRGGGHVRRMAHPVCVVKACSWGTGLGRQGLVYDVFLGGRAGTDMDAPGRPPSGTCSETCSGFRGWGLRRSGGQAR